MKSLLLDSQRGLTYERRQNTASGLRWYQPTWNRIFRSPLRWPHEAIQRQSFESTSFQILSGPESGR
jgi:hypothetical protein